MTEGQEESLGADGPVPSSTGDSFMGVHKVYTFAI